MAVTADNPELSGGEWDLLGYLYRNGGVLVSTSNGHWKWFSSLAEKSAGDMGHSLPSLGSAPQRLHEKGMIKLFAGSSDTYVMSAAGRTRYEAL